MTDMTMGQRITAQRKKLGLSQEALGDQLGVSRQAISKWETDGAVPDVDKLIALSRLFGVSVGWLLGVEAPETQENELSEAQLKMVAQLVKQAQPVPHKAWRTLLVAAIAMIALLVSCAMAKQLRDTAAQASASESQMTVLEDQLQDIRSRLDRMELASLESKDDLLLDYTLNVVPLDIQDIESGEQPRARIDFSGATKVWVAADTGYLCVRTDAGEIAREACTLDAARLTASVTLDVADGYELYFLLVHESGTQEMQLLHGNATEVITETFPHDDASEQAAEDPTYGDAIEQMTQTFTIPVEVTQGSFAYQDGALILKDYTATFQIPSAYAEEWDERTWARCEYRLYRRPKDTSQYEIFTANMMDHIHYDPETDSYQVTGQEIRFEGVDAENMDHIRLSFYIRLSRGVDRNHLITLFFPDGNGGLTE